MIRPRSPLSIGRTTDGTRTAFSWQGRRSPTWRPKRFPRCPGACGRFTSARWRWPSIHPPRRTRRCSLARRGAGRLSSIRTCDRPSSATKPHTARFERLTRLADIVKLSDDDAAWIYPDLEIANVLERILGLGPRLVAITLARSGALA